MTIHNIDSGKNKKRREVKPISKKLTRHKRIIPEEIIHQQQPDDLSCAYTCVAMVVQKSVQQVKLECARDLGLNGLLTQFEIQKMLAYYGLLGIKSCLEYDGRLEGESIYFVTVPALNMVGGLHVIVVDARGEGFKIYDPQKGRDNKLFYNETCVNNFCDQIKIIDPLTHRLED